MATTTLRTPDVRNETGDVSRATHGDTDSHRMQGLPADSQRKFSIAVPGELDCHEHHDFNMAVSQCFCQQGRVGRALAPTEPNASLREPFATFERRLFCGSLHVILLLVPGALARGARLLYRKS